LNFSSTSCPLTSTCGARPGEKIKSLTWALALRDHPKPANEGHLKTGQR
jgi:hypothetical protein